MSNENGSIVARQSQNKEALTANQYRVDYSEPYSRTYSNVARVANNEHDMCIDFAVLGSPQEITENPEAPLQLRVVSQVFIPHGVVPGLLRILYKHLTAAEKVEARRAIQQEDELVTPSEDNANGS